MLNDHTNGKVFVVGEASPEVDAALRSLVNYEPPSAWRSPRRVILMFSGVGACVLLVVVVWRRGAKRRR